ncbi:MAG: hypothetical protein ACM3VZ_06820 [Acidobacteriota bacterium]
MNFKLVFPAAGVLLALHASAFAGGLAPLDDEQLSEVRGADGVYLSLRNFSFNSEARLGYAGLTLTYTMPNPADPFFEDPSKAVSFIEKGGISISRSDALDPFADPYQIQIQTFAVSDDFRSGSEIKDPANPDLSLALPDKMEVIRLLNPKNLGAAGDDQVWQMRYDWKVGDGVVVHDMGSYIVKDLKVYGGGLDLAPAWSYNNKDDVRGTSFGLDINMEIGALMLRPRGYADSGDTRTEMAFTGIKIGRANADLTGVDPDKTKAWRVADVIQQPGIITAVTDSNGNSTLHMGIEWYRGKVTDPENLGPARPESIGAMSIDNVTIRNSAGAKDLGGMSIGGIQIRYLDINFRNAN